MMKITIGIVAALAILTTSVQAGQATVRPKSQVSVPSYKSGFGFGLAGYYSNQKAPAVSAKC